MEQTTALPPSSDAPWWEDLVQCVGYAKTKKRRCGVKLEPDQDAGRWLDPATGAHGGPVDGHARCQYHPQDTDPDGWAPWEQDPPPPPEDPEPDPEPVGPDRQLPAGRDVPHAEGPDLGDLPELDDIPDAGPGADRDEAAPDLDELDRLAADMLGDTPTGDGDAPQDPQPGPGPTTGPTPDGGPSPAPDAEPPEVWTREDVVALLGFLNAPLDRIGAEPVPDAELREGAKILQGPLNRIANRIPPERWLPVIWLGKTYVPRVVQAGAKRAEAQAEAEPEPAPSSNGARPQRPTAEPELSSSWSE